MGRLFKQSLERGCESRGLNRDLRFTIPIMKIIFNSSLSHNLLFLFIFRLYLQIAQRIP